MKKAALTILATVLALSTSFAKVRTVSNNTSSPGQYTVLQTAVDASAANDTVYIHGSPTNYGTVTVVKPLVIIGAGSMPNKNLLVSTQISTLNLSYSANNTTNASGSKIYGCEITGALYINAKPDGTGGVSNLIISRNRIPTLTIVSNGANTHSNIIVENNVINYLYLYRANNFIVKNNIIANFSNGAATATAGLGYTLVTNNIFTSTVSNCALCIFSNNIFHLANATYPNGIGNNTFTNNIFTTQNGTSIDATILNNGNNSGAGNLVNVDPAFVNYDISKTLIYNYTYSAPANAADYLNFNLEASSPGKTMGTDGTDVGIYGGATPFVEGTPANSRFRYFPMPVIPVVLDVTINNTSVIQNGTLNINFKARKQK